MVPQAWFEPTDSPPAEAGVSKFKEADKKPLWLRCVDDTFVTWPHNLEHSQLFIHHLNSLRPSIKFTMEIEKDGTLPFSMCL